MSLLPAAIPVYILVNIAAFLLFHRDKRLAERGAWRTSERDLLIAAVFGPLGAMTAMRLFRHKTQKMKFRLIPLFLCLHAALALIYMAGL
ncbi:MAG: DUF1294 domain-containing protein [Methanomicrobiales archaeon]|nr:DUF1294 domain-containing protein [Methanomicrobiales archaeon]